MLEIVAYYFWAIVTLTSDLSCTKIVYGASLSSILYDIELSNLVCGYIYWPWCATYCFRVSVSLTSVLDRTSPEHICILCEVGVKIWCEDTFGILLLGHIDPGLWPWF